MTNSDVDLVWCLFIPITLCACGGRRRVRVAQFENRKRPQDKIFIRCGVDQRHERVLNRPKEKDRRLQGTLANWGSASGIATYDSLLTSSRPWANLGTPGISLQSRAHETSET
ncbi:hypothetical protein F4818DRAFT_374830 [Hypoxylon cercidicola]|nr:hypothetical protein F4818DRAFT_374830 [Hypoxylon cercidicola]